MENIMLAYSLFRNYYKVLASLLLSLDKATSIQVCSHYKRCSIYSHHWL